MLLAAALLASIDSMFKVGRGAKNFLQQFKYLHLKWLKTILGPVWSFPKMENSHDLVVSKILNNLITLNLTLYCSI